MVEIDRKQDMFVHDRFLNPSGRPGGHAGSGGAAAASRRIPRILGEKAMARWPMVGSTTSSAPARRLLSWGAT